MVTLDTLVTSDTLPDMAACNIRNIDESLLRAMKVKAASEGMTLRDWVIRALTVAVGWENDTRAESAEVLAGSGKGDMEVSGRVRAKRNAVTAHAAPNPDCPRCGKRLREWGPGWNCEDCRTNFPKA